MSAPRRQQELGYRDTRGLAAPAISNTGDNPFGTGFWVARWDPPSLPRVAFEIYKMSMRAPQGAQFNLYVDNRYVAGTARAQLNEWNGVPIEVYPGQSVIAYWSVSATPAPYLAIKLRTIPQ
jgi:hypothetical protein